LLGDIGFALVAVEHDVTLGCVADDREFVRAEVL
jgi:hypothetical protein